jgi:hypothetical protein
MPHTLISPTFSWDCPFKVKFCYVVYSSRMFNGFNNFILWSIISLITLGKCAHRTPEDVRESHTYVYWPHESKNCVWKAKTFSQLNLSSVEHVWVEHHVAVSKVSVKMMQLTKFIPFCEVIAPGKSNILANSEHFQILQLTNLRVHPPVRWLPREEATFWQARDISKYFNWRNLHPPLRWFTREEATFWQTQNIYYNWRNLHPTVRWSPRV